MTNRVLIILRSEADRLLMHHLVGRLVKGDRFEVKRAQRSLKQNERMWAMLGEVAKQAKHCGRKYTPNEWKCLFMHALGQELRFLPSLDEDAFIPIGYQSSDLSVAEMTELIELIFAWGAKIDPEHKNPA